VKVSAVKDMQSGVYEVFSPFIHFSSNLDVIERAHDMSTEILLSDCGFIEIQCGDSHASL
jgi:hypothetical protein